ncbi:MAG: tRNA epoxyqueuosine(34) reductase QueG [Bdellovibrionaceae bacterium]|nr:tRNA epoxyqueuosine(34) reductase QueG [Bdellovibrio sp.]
MTDFKITHNDSLHEMLGQFKNQLGFNQIEIGPLGTPLTIEFYEKWLADGHYGSMHYLKDHLITKKDPQALAPELKSVISIAQSYFPTVIPTLEKNPARVALYAQNNDYHHWLKEKLVLVIAELQKQFPGEVFLPFVDSGPVLERNWAYQNSLGWFGKNTCILHPLHGSLFFVAEILTSLPADANRLELVPDFCGKCQKCIDICPTGALVKPKEMKADLCISYLTIEAKTVAPIELREKIGDWFFGCDLCQTVCPWNEKVFRKLELPATHQTSTDFILNLNGTERSELVEYFRWLLTASHNQIQKKLLGSALARAGAKGLKRNALIVIGNRQLKELKTEVEDLEINEFAELKLWTLKSIN